MTQLTIGYARVSRDDQRLDLQRDALTKEKCQKIFEEKKSGKDMDRPELIKVLDQLRAGDTLVVWRLDRLGRSLKNLLETINKLEERKINFKSLTENIDTTTATGKLIFHMFGALAEFERNIIRERTNAGLVAARSRGKLGGRPRKKLDPEKLALAFELYEQQKESVHSISKMLGICRPTFYVLLRRYKKAS